MVDGKGILDALLGAVSTGGQPGQSGAAGGLGDLLGQVLSGSQSQMGAQAGSGGLGDLLGQVLGGGQQPQANGQTGGGIGDILGQVLGGAGATGSSGGLFGAIKDAVGKNPGLAQAAVIGLGGLLLGSGRARGVAGGAAKLGGAALIGGLAYKALKSFQGVQPDASAQVPVAVPEPEHYTPVAATNEGALKLVRTMVAAAMADGSLDESEQQRIVGQLSQDALADEDATWLENELANPATPKELAANISSQHEAVEVYAAARVTIDPDKQEEKVFLTNLAEALALPVDLVAQVDQAVDGIKVANAG